MTAELLSPDLMRRLDRLAVVGRRPRAGTLAGDRRSARRGQSVEFADFRQYVPGDDFRQVDWNAYARLERFFLKLFVAEEDTTVHILLDVSRSMGWGDPPKLDFARRVAAAVGYVSLAGLDWVTVTPFDAAPRPQPRPRRGRAAAPALFGDLAALRADGGTDLRAAVRRHVAAARQAGPLLVLSDLYDPRWQEALRVALGARFDVTVVHVLSPEELEPALEGDLRLVDDETLEAVDVTADGEALAAYRQTLAAWQAEIGAWCAARATPYIPVRTDFPLDDFVLGTLHRHGVVA